MREPGVHILSDAEVAFIEEFCALQEDQKTWSKACYNCWQRPGITFEPDMGYACCPNCGAD